MSLDKTFEEMGSVIAQVRNTVVEFLPSVLVAAGVVLIGIAAAYLTRYLLVRVVRNIGRFFPSRRMQQLLPPSRMERPAVVVGKLLFWIVILFFLTVATEALGLPVITSWLGTIVAYLPRILAAALVVAAGVVGGTLLRDAIEGVAAKTGMAYGTVLGRFGQYAAVLVAILIAVEQTGIDITFLTNVIMILVAALLFGAALAFGLGARTIVSNILSAYYLQKTYKVGDRVRIGDTEGEITQITPVAVILETPEGRVCEPASRFAESTSLLIKEDK